MSLVDQLIVEHCDIIKTFEEVKSLGISSKEGHARLAQVKASLLSHLKQEDELLYPRLKSAAKEDPKLQVILDLFASDMNKVTAVAMGFFNKYDKYNSCGKGLEFARDFGEFISAFKIRARKEEKLLYNEYRKLE